MILLIAFGLSELLSLLALLAVVATVAGYAWYTIRGQKSKVKTDAIQGWREVADLQEARIDLLESKVSECESEHKRCEAKVNRITTFNLRLQAREVQYQRTIHRLEHALRLPLTDFLETPDDCEDSLS